MLNSRADDFDTLRQTWSVYLTGGTNLNLLDPAISNWVAGVGSTANGNWTSMNKAADRTYLWANAAGWATNSAHITTSFYRLSTMAQGWATKGSSVYNNSALAADIISGLDWLYANVYNETQSEYNNWWDWEIGSPNDLNNAMVLMYPLLSGNQITNYCKAIDHFRPTVNGTGANRVWTAEVLGVRGVVGRNASKVAAARDGLSDVSGGGAYSVFSYVTSGDGFYRDGSFIQHGKHPYTAGYGINLLAVISKLLVWLDGTPWAVTDPQRTNVVNWCYDSFEPTIYYGSMPEHLRGRGIASSGSSGYDAGETAINGIFRIAQTAPTNDATRLNRLVKYWGQVNPDARLTSYVDIDLMPAAQQLLTNASVLPRGELIGHYRFPGMDRVMHLRPGFGFGLSLFSSRIYNYESINSQNYHGWFTAYGMTYLWTTNDWWQYADNYWPTIDPYHLPGTTVVQTPLANGANAGKNSSQNWVGGTALSGASGVTAGAAGMALADVNSSLVGKKSWFMFDDEIVCLGAGITCDSAVGVDTTVENRKLGVTYGGAFTVNGTMMPATVGWSSNLLNVSWCALDISGGYYFPGGANLKAACQAGVGSWSSIGTGNSSASVTRNYLTLIWEHGSKPVNATYAYVLLPNYNAAAVGQYAAKPEISILTNTSAMQAVRETSLGILAANFWTNGSQTVDMLTVSNQCSVITRESGGALELDVSDPTWTNTGLINLTVNRNCLGVVNADSGVTVRQLNPLKISVNVNGARGKSFMARFQVNDPSLIALTNSDAYGTTSFNLAGNWSSGRAPVETNDYSTTSLWTLRSPSSASNFVFAGKSLTLAGSGQFANQVSLLSKQTNSGSGLSFKQLIFSQLGVFQNAGTGGTDIKLEGSLMLTNGGGSLTPADGNIIVAGSLGGGEPLWLGDLASVCSYGVIFSGAFSNFTGSIYATNLANSFNAAAAMLTFSNAVDQTYAGKLVLMHSATFTNAIAKQGAGTLTWSGNHTYDGNTIVEGGTLHFGPGSSGISDFLQIGTGAACRVATTLPILTNTATVSIRSGGRLWLTNGVKLAVSRLVLAGALQATGTWGSSGSPAINVNDACFGGGGVLIVGSNSVPDAINPTNLVWTGDGTIAAPGNGTWNTMVGNNVWNNGVGLTGNTAWAASGDTNAVFGGTDANCAIMIGSGVSALNLSFQNSGYTLWGISAQTVTLTSASGLSVVPQIQISPGKTCTIGNNVALASSQSLVIGAHGASTGGTLIIANGGSVKETSSGRNLAVDGLGTKVSVQAGGAFQITSTGGGSETLSVGHNAGSSASLSVDGGTVSAAGAAGVMKVGNDGSGTLNINAGMVNLPLTAAGIILGNTGGSDGTINLNGGTITTPQVAKGSGVSATFHFNGGTLKANKSNAAYLEGLDAANVQAGGAVIDDGGYAITIRQSLRHGTNSEEPAIDGGLTKKGAGVLTLSGTNTYNGNTTLAGGTLALRGAGAIDLSAGIAIGGGTTLDVSGRDDQTLTLNSGQTLTGDGQIHGKLTALAGAMVNPGGTIGTLTVQSNIMLSGTLMMELNRTNLPNSDQLSAAGELAGGGVLAVTNLGPALQVGDVFLLFNQPAGGFTAVQLPTGYGWANRVAVDGSIQVTSVIALNPTNLTVQVGLNQLTIKWPQDHIGWRLQVQTNGLNDDRWTEVPASATTNQIAMHMGATNGAVFFRLVYP